MPDSRLKTIFFLFSTILVWTGCGRKKPEQPIEHILARVGPVSISRDEFLRRAEYTPRPVYCRGDNYIHRKIVMNSLIAEKLLALEGGQNKSLQGNQSFQAFIRGRREQAMRQWLYHTIAEEQVWLDSQAVQAQFQSAGRTYRVSYFTLPDRVMADSIAIHLRTGTLESAFAHYLGATNLPTREVAWGEPLDRWVHEALFAKSQAKGEVIGPVQTMAGEFVFLQVLGWTDRMAITSQQIEQRRREVEERLTRDQALDLYEAFVSETMRGRRVEFMAIALRSLAEVLAPVYHLSQSRKNDAFNQEFWEKKEVVDIDRSVSNYYQRNRDLPLYRIDGQEYTIGEFSGLLESHPLVFRKRNFPSSEFLEQLKLAVVDLIRDQYLNQEAYARGYDQISAVEGNVRMWRDNILAHYQMHIYLERAGFTGDFSIDYMEAIDLYLNPYIDSLQAAYSDMIEINTDLFEELSLTSIDMHVLQTNLPYPVVVPNFPVLTTDHHLDYGRKMAVGSNDQRAP